uniref:Ras-GEF domain-containing protein n=1 Tax=Megaselia scalaris TaxID=36166 RepID=T1GD48_MEGSC
MNTPSIPLITQGTFTISSSTQPPSAGSSLMSSISKISEPSSFRKTETEDETSDSDDETEGSFYQVHRHCHTIANNHQPHSQPPVKPATKRYNNTSTHSVAILATTQQTSQIILNTITAPRPHVVDDARPPSRHNLRQHNSLKLSKKPTVQRPQTTAVATNPRQQIKDNYLVYRDGNLISGTLSALIQHLIPTFEYYPENEYIFAFLLSVRLFLRPHELLARISEVWLKQQDSLNSETLTRKSANNLLRLLAEWVNTFPYDFRDDRLMQNVRTVTRHCIDFDRSLKPEVNKILESLVKYLKVLDKYEEFLQLVIDDTCSIAGSDNNVPSLATSSSSSIGVPSNDHTSSSSSSASNSLTSFFDTTEIISNMCPSPNVLAQQLTHIELDRLCHIGPEEFQCRAINDIKKTRNLESYVHWFNRLSYLVATEIVKHPKKKQRVRVIEFWIETARECCNIGNFNSLMAIIAGLNMSPISRLKKTWSKVQSDKFAVLEHQMDPTSNFNSYRSTLKAAIWRAGKNGANNEREKIIIPFFSLLVKDLYFLNEGCSNKLPNGHINFEKFWQLAKQVKDFNTWKKVQCPFETNEKLIMFLQTSNILNEAALSMASFVCEPPDNNQEKDRYKTLKSDAKRDQSGSSI